VGDELEVRRNPAPTEELLGALVRVWVDVTEDGGAVGLSSPAEPDDARALAEAHLDGVASGREDLVVAFEAGRVLGFGFLELNGQGVLCHWAAIKRLQRHPRARGRGVGAAVLTELEAASRDRGLLMTTVTVRDGTGYERFYLDRGYRLDAVLPDRLQLRDGRLLDELHLSKRLDQPQLAADALAVQRLDPELPLPQRAHPGDAGLDLQAREGVTLAPGERAVVPTGVAIALPSGTVGLLHPRSGLAAEHGVGMVNAPGTVDEGYRGELKVVLINLDPTTPVTLDRGQRVAQLVVQPVSSAPVQEVDELGASPRGAGGFGSTGE